MTQEINKRSERLSAPVTLPPITAGTVIRPEFIRLPKPGTLCPHTGLSRTYLFNLWKESKGKIRSVSLRKPGQIKGARLIHLDSLIQYLNQFEENCGGVK